MARRRPGDPGGYGIGCRSRVESENAIRGRALLYILSHPDDRKPEARRLPYAREQA